MKHVRLTLLFEAEMSDWTDRDVYIAPVVSLETKAIYTACSSDWRYIALDTQHVTNVFILKVLACQKFKLDV